MIQGKKAAYKFDPHTLQFVEDQKTWKGHLLHYSKFFFMVILFAIIVMLIAYNTIDSPKEKSLKREIAEYRLRFELMNEKLDKIQGVLAEIQQHDDDVYRVIFEAEPVPTSIRQAGYGGVDRYAELQGLENSDILTEVAKKIDNVTGQLVVQSKSLEEVYQMAKDKEKMLAHIPAIQPISNKELKRIASPFGYRIHPIYKTWKFHDGIDFTAPRGSKIYATGDGVVTRTKISRRGYGNEVIIDHGYSYKTRYAHLYKILVKKGQKVKRGQVIGLVGNTGLSTAPHLHYEVIKGDKKVNPMYYFFNDLTPEEFDHMLELSKMPNQSFD
jgi:murein DD-endopeptidase MepM/ murein hydrolase activator NlpD